MKNESQYGLLLLQQYLYEHTDDQHPVSVADILAFWREHGIQAGRKSVYSAIEVLQSNGMDIVCVKSTQNRYFVGERLFELPELKLLVDAVESSRFITAKKSERLIEKLGKLTSESHARQLERHIYMDGTAKPENECIYYSVDEIHNAIQEKRQITFQYYEYTPQKEKISQRKQLQMDCGATDGKRHSDAEWRREMAGDKHPISADQREVYWRHALPEIL